MPQLANHLFWIHTSAQSFQLVPFEIKQINFCLLFSDLGQGQVESPVCIL